MLKEYFEYLSSINKDSDIIEISDDWPWLNSKWSNAYFRWIHLELYCHKNVEVLHYVMMPQISYDIPIFGLDIIKINDIYSGLFLDATPTLNNKHYYDISVFQNKRIIPEWADFFSENFVCCKPTIDEIEYTKTIIKSYISNIDTTKSRDANAIKNSQLNYLNSQRRNPQTFKMLKSHIGDDLATKFVEDILFPISDII